MANVHVDVPCSARGTWKRLPRRVWNVRARTNASLRRGGTTRASSEGGEGATTSTSLKHGDAYEVVLRKPLGLVFCTGADGGTYVDEIVPGGHAEADGRVQVGDKVVRTSAVFGDKMWDADDHARTMAAIIGRSGSVAFRLRRRDGQRVASTHSSLHDAAVRESEVSDQDWLHTSYERARERQRMRKDLLSHGLIEFRGGKFEDALQCFKKVLVLNPESKEAAVAYYNLACCHSVMLGSVEEGMKCLGRALSLGFQDSGEMLQDAALAHLRENAKEEFDALMKEYDVGTGFLNDEFVEAMLKVPKAAFYFVGKGLHAGKNLAGSLPFVKRLRSPLEEVANTMKENIPLSSVEDMITGAPTNYPERVAIRARDIPSDNSL